MVFNLYYNHKQTNMNLKRTSIAIVCLCLIFGCTKDNQPEPVSTAGQAMQGQAERMDLTKSWGDPPWVFDKGDEIQQGTKVYSWNGKCYLHFRWDGNLVLCNEFGTVVGQTKTHQRPNPPNKCIFQHDGDFVLYRGGQPTWHSNTGHPETQQLILTHTGEAEGWLVYIWAIGLEMPQIVWYYDDFGGVFPGETYPWW